MGFLSIFGDYRFLSASSFLTSGVCFILAVLIFAANFHSLPCRLAAFFNLTVSLWSFFYGAMLVVGTGSVGTWASKLLTCFALLLPCFYTHLMLLLLNKEHLRVRLITVNYIYSFVAITAVLCTEYLVSGSIPKLDMPAYTEGGTFYFFVPLHTTANMIYCTVLIVMGLRSAVGSQKKQLQVLLAATVIGFCTGIFSYFLVFNISLKPVLNPLVIVNPILVAYAIVKHRFLDIRKLARNTLVFSLLFICLLCVVSALLFVFQKALLERVGFSASVCQFLAIMAALMLYTPLKRGLSTVTQKLLYQHIQDASVIFRRLSEDLFKFREVKKLAEEMTMRVASCLSLECIAFYRRAHAQNGFTCQSAVWSHTDSAVISEKDPLIQYLQYSEEVLLNPYGLTDRTAPDYERELSVSVRHLQEEALNVLIQGEWAVALPIFNKNQLDSLILMGHKKSDASWTQEELGVLESFAHCFSLALVNADAAEAIRTLQRKILASERDASAGALIAGVDHEAKNPLHAASLALSALDGFLVHPKFLAEPREAQEASVKETMQSVLEDIEEVNHVIQHLSDLAEQKPLHIQEGVSLTEVCRKAIKTSGAADKIRMILDIPETSRLTCDPDALQEILANLIRNASQAVAGDVWIRAYDEDNMAIVEVEDSGSGIPASIGTRIFEPFFTTKDHNDGGGSTGTGMGLFIVRESMRAMGGEIELVSGSKQGAIFRLMFRSLPGLAGGVLYES